MIQNRIETSGLDDTNRIETSGLDDTNKLKGNIMLWKKIRESISMMYKIRKSLMFEGL